MFKPTALLVLAAAIVVAQPSLAQSKKRKPAEDAWSTFSNRTDNEDGSSSLTFGAKVPTTSTIETKMGLDFGLGGRSDVTRDPAKLLERPADHNSGAGWASMAVPAMPLGFTKAQVDARFDPTAEQSKVGVAVSRPIGPSFLMTLQNSYAVTSAVPLVPTAHNYNVESGHSVRFDVLSTHTAFSAGTRSSTIDDREFRTISAEQKIIGPLSISGTVSETATGELDKVLRAGFRTTW